MNLSLTKIGFVFSFYYVAYISVFSLRKFENTTCKKQPPQKLRRVPQSIHAPSEARKDEELEDVSEEFVSGIEVT